MAQKHIDLWFRLQKKRHITSILTSLASIVVFGGSGYLLDRVFETKPFLTVLGIIVSYIITQIVLIKILKKITKNQP